MTRNNIFSCYIIGADNLTIQCAEIVISSGHELLGMISSSEKIKAWCMSNSINNFTNLESFQSNTHKKRPDFLFSIVNEFILPKELIKFPKYYAINYHDAPLPKYAGLYATSQAILNNENTHAVSWHIMDEGVDTGDILKQPFFKIDKNDTAFSLNLKCYEHAISSFQQLVKDLEFNKITPIKQNLNKRTYYGLKNKPSYLGFVLWDESFEKNDRLCRALKLGDYPNKLVSPKVLIGKDIYILSAYDKANVSSEDDCGTITNISNEYIQVSTKTADFLIFDLMTVNGYKVSIEFLIERYHLSRGLILPTPNHAFIDSLTKHVALKPNIERFWVKQFACCVQEEISFLPKVEKSSSNYFNNLIKTKIPVSCLNIIKNKFADYRIADILLACVFIFLYRLNNYKNLSLMYKDILFSDENRPEISSFIAKHIPITSKFNSENSFSDTLNFFINEKDKLIENHGYAKDIFVRYPEINNILARIYITINITDNIKEFNDNKLNICIADDGLWISFHCKKREKFIQNNYPFLKNINKNFLDFLTDVLNDPNAPIYKFSLVNKLERKMLLELWNNTAHSYNHKKLLHQYFEERVRKSPDAIAVIHENKSITFNDLNQKANKLAHYLNANNITSNNIIGVCLDRSIEMVISILGILKAGAAYLPLDPDNPQNRTTYILDDSRADLVLTTDKSLNSLQGNYVKIVNIYEVIANASLQVTNLATKCLYRDLAYAIYTSGSTGRPKGVIVSHKSICNHMLWMQREYKFTKYDVFLQKTPFTFDASIWEIFAPLIIGAKLVMAPKHSHTNAYDLVQLIKNHMISVLQVVPTMLNELIHTYGFNTCHSLKQVFSGGEALLPTTVNNFYQHNHYGAILHNLYGPTETTIQVLTTSYDKNDVGQNICRIGKPIANTKVYVLDDEMQLLPIGIPGELYIGGDCLAVGYLHNNKLTNERFISNPFDSRANTLIYKTGDLVKWLGNGNIEYLGRIDNQIKIRGFRVELSEVEATLMKINGVDQCVVSPELTSDNQVSLSAYMTIRKNVELDIQEVRKYLSKYIPNYMIPTRFYKVNNFFFTSSGKIDRKILPIPVGRLEANVNYVAPTNDVEKILENIWCKHLKLDKISIYDNFFDIGGDSLVGMKIITEIGEKFSITLSIKNLFEQTNIYFLAEKVKNKYQKLEETEKNIIESCLVPLKTIGNKNPLFLIHPIGGSVFWYKSFIKYLDVDQPLYAIQDPSLDTNEIKFNSIEEIAKCYLDVIKEVQPSGNYFIGGASFGTTVAVEIAKQLIDKGEHVSAIISFDGWAFYPSIQNDLKTFQALMYEQNSRIFGKYIENNIKNSDFLLKLQLHRENLLIKYKLPLIKSKFILFKAQTLSEIFQFDAPLNWWEGYVTSQIELHLVPDNQESMFYEPNIKVLTKKLSDSLRRIRTFVDKAIMT